eukprot:Seg142.2 transcript_id=Seg142.2/GoldUCD/mRNA.D3Y31 product="hypothetical protein" protein_id=Seg142.2/GoldUCD/D3Y31
MLQLAYHSNLVPRALCHIGMETKRALSSPSGDKGPGKEVDMSAEENLYRGFSSPAATSCGNVTQLQRPTTHDPIQQIDLSGKIELAAAVHLRDQLMLIMVSG